MSDRILVDFTRKRRPKVGDAAPPFVPVPAEAIWGRLGWVGGSAVGECLMFLTGDLEGMVILYIMDDLVQPL